MTLALLGVGMVCYAAGTLRPKVWVGGLGSGFRLARIASGSARLRQCVPENRKRQFWSAVVSVKPQYIGASGGGGRITAREPVRTHRIFLFFKAGASACSPPSCDDLFCVGIDYYE